jgi:hypothetical protein
MAVLPSDAEATRFSARPPADNRRVRGSPARNVDQLIDSHRVMMCLRSFGPAGAHRSANASVRIRTPSGKGE